MKFTASRLYTNRLIRPTGPTPCDILAVGEAGGEEEHRRGVAFCGKSGELLDTYLAAARLPRHLIRVTNLHPYWTGPGNPDPSEDQISETQNILLDEIRSCRPRYILAVGRIAARWFLGPDLTLEVAHGISHRWGRSGILVVPAFHPAAGFHDPGAAQRSAWDIRQFAELTRGKPRLRHTADEYPSPRYSWSRGGLANGLRTGSPAIDTESTPEGPYCVSVSDRVGTAKVHRVEDLPDKTKIKFTYLHNALYDLEVLANCGVSVRSFYDTMIAAFALQVEPQGLKALALRWLGMKMDDFQDVVRPYHTAAVLSYLESAAQHASRVPPPQERLVLRDGKYKIYKPQPLPRRLANILRDVQKKKSEIDLVDRWQKIEPDQREELERLAGKFPAFSFALVPKKTQLYYSARDADATKRLAPILIKRVKKMGLDRVVALDIAAVPVISRMQQTGMLLDVPFTRTLHNRLARQIDKRLDTLRSLPFTGPNFLPSSSPQVADVLFSKLHLPTARLTKVARRPSTDDKSLETVLIEARKKGDSRAESFITNLQEFREDTKFLSTFVAPLPGYLRADGRIHPDIRITRVVTGRPATADPNFLAFPKRSEKAKDIRNCFVAAKGSVLISLDFSQIELRVLADQSEDPTMVSAFRNGEDLHSKTASLLFGIALSAVDELQHRYPAKTINFAIAYGIMAQALYEQLLLKGVKDPKTGRPYTLEACDAIIRRWFSLFPGVLGYLRAKHAEARRFGFVRTPYSGRLRYLPNIHVPADGRNRYLRHEAERQAGNFPIQGGATDYAKEKLAGLGHYLKRNKLWDVVFPLLWIHDEFLLEAPKKIAEQIAKEIQAMMEDDHGRFKVPIKADYSIGERWGEL